jgi:hypothetical protein
MIDRTGPYVTGDHQVRRYDAASGMFLGVFAVDPSGGDSG